ncbi:MAG TPA: cytochrome d ubiquinol oxidase subunit II, partial [Chlamydiales bacterium]|nr:cytochrome d ubiquinol oxidase subunit II [Chlamydiales bacterium]
MLANFWFLIVVVALIFYAMLDGFDLGVGMLHPFARDDTERRIFLNAIGPVWDGNEVWLVIVGGALFAGFTPVYATVFSAFYTPLMALLCALILRAVAIEFRSKVESITWRHLWDWIFSLSSLMIAFLAGIVLGCHIQGIPLDPYGNFTGTLSDFFSPFTILLGMTTCALFAMHGNVYLLMKTEGALHDHMRSWVRYTIGVFILFYIALSGWTLHKFPYMLETIKDYPVLFAIPLLTIAGILAIPYFIHRGFDGWAFLSSCFSILMLFVLFGIGTYPVMVLSTIEPATRSLTVY